MSKPIVRAIDVGYGNTKFTVLRQGPGEIHCGVFPSIAPHASSMPDLAGDLLQRRNTAVIEVNGVPFEVGTDAMLARDASYGRTLDDDFCTTDAYLALVRGAIHYMGVDKIDLLVVGLPVSTHSAKKRELEQRLMGNHTIPCPRRPGTEPQQKIVHVGHVTALPQPIGAFFDFSIQEGRLKKMRNETNLVIDPGYFTLDWVVAQGTKIVNARSGTHNGGMSSILAAVGEMVSLDIGEQLSDFSRIDDALCSGTNPRFYGKEFNIGKYLPLAIEKARQHLAVLTSGIGDSTGIKNILLTGGGAKFYRDLVAEKFPRHVIQTTPDPLFANVRGFQFAGESWASHSLKASVAF